jgi:general secretion pathway protein E
VASRYYIRFRGRKLGPLTVERLHSLARRGRFARHYEVSTDGKRWAPAADYPELFPDNSPAEDDGGFGDEFDMDEMPEDPFSPGLEEPAAKKKPQKSRTSRPRRQQTFQPLPTPPPISIDGPIIDDPMPLASSDSGAEDDDYLPPLVQEVIETDSPTRRVRKRKRPAVQDDTDDIEDSDNETRIVSADGPINVNVTLQSGTTNSHGHSSENEDDGDDGGRHTAAPVARGRTTSSRQPHQSPRKPAPSLFDVAASKTRKKNHVEGEDEEAEEASAPKKKRFFGLFGGDDDDNSHLEPYLAKLHTLTESMGKLKFGLEEMILIGSGGEEINVAGHIKKGDGIDLISVMTMLAYQSKSTDIHFEPTRDGSDVRMRIDGSLVQLVSLPRKPTNKTYGVVKVLCESDLGSRRSVQEGNYSVLAPGRRSDYRVSFTPSVHGQKLAIRVLDLENSPQSIKQLGAPPRMLRTLTDVMTQNAGMILMCGPTGSGKTTTLYSLIRSIDVKTRNVMTLEDPVEYQIDGVTQIPIDNEHGKGFAQMLPALLRQDPDVLLIGEIRDAASAKIAMQATMTGHLVLSTVHAPDTLSTLYRLLDLNADANMVGSALDLVMSQRLVKQLCRDCRIRRKINKPEAQRLGRYAKDTVYEPKGCRQCLGTGFKGRRAIFELLDVKHQLGDAVYSAKSLSDLRKAVDRKTFVTLRQNGHQLVAKGVTCFSEIDRVIGVS